jgi:hypothetical protein
VISVSYVRCFRIFQSRVGTAQIFTCSFVTLNNTKISFPHPCAKCLSGDYCQQYMVRSCLESCAGVIALPTGGRTRQGP